MTETVHLYRGAPAVRSWSKYQQAVERWTLCGIDRSSNAKAGNSPASATEDPSLVNCPRCRELMRPTKAEIARAKVQKADMTVEDAVAELQAHVEKTASWLVEHGHAGAGLPEDVRVLSFRLLSYVPPEEVHHGGWWMYCLQSGELYNVTGTWIWRSPRRFRGAELADLEIREVSLVEKGSNTFAKVAYFK
jgi:hypothetical protein